MLEALRDGSNESVWRDFDLRFRPIVVAFARRLGLDSADAADVAQETLLQFVRDYRDGKYDRSRGRLGAWLMGIARHRVDDLRRRVSSRRETRGESAIVMLPDANQLGTIWDEECHQVVLEEAFRELERTSRVSPRTLKAFRLHVVEQLEPSEVARRLGTSIRSVYLAKHRCLHRLREVMDVLNERYELA